jgi:hypothetical protein
MWMSRLHIYKGLVLLINACNEIVQRLLYIQSDLPRVFLSGQALYVMLHGRLGGAVCCLPAVAAAHAHGTHGFLKVWLTVDFSAVCCWAQATWQALNCSISSLQHRLVTKCCPANTSG